jgi:hypothetical protein
MLSNECCRLILLFQDIPTINHFGYQARGRLPVGYGPLLLLASWPYLKPEQVWKGGMYRSVKPECILQLQIRKY